MLRCAPLCPAVAVFGYASHVAKLPKLRITEDDSTQRAGSHLATARELGAPQPLAPPTRVDGGPLSASSRFVTVDPRRVLPCVPELHTFPVGFVHDHPMVQRAGGLPLIVEGIAEFLPGVRFDKPETIPPPVRAVMRALHRRTPFGLVIIVEPKAWWVDLRADDLRLPRG